MRPTPEGSGSARAARRRGAAIAFRRGGCALTAAALLVAAWPGAALSRFERVSLTPRAVAAGGACAAAADDLSALFFNPAGLASIAGPVLYADYGETRFPRRGRETRAAAAVGARFARCALGWYRLDGDGVVEDLLLAGCARTLLSGSQGSYVAVGANAAVGRVAGPADGDGAAWSKGTADAGIVVRPLPVISFAWAAGNLLEARAEESGRDDDWKRSSRFGISYFWEDAIVFSFENRRADGASTKHYGVLARTATPVEIMFGLSDGEMTGGARWNGARVRCTVAFDGGGPGGATWTLGLEASFGAGGGREDR